MGVKPLIPLSFLFFFLFFICFQLNKFEMKSRLIRFIAEDPQDLLLPKEEAIRLSTEAFRLWAVAAGYGQACDIYRYGPKLEQWEQRGGGHKRKWTSCSRGSEFGISRITCCFLQGSLTSLSLVSCSKTQFLKLFMLFSCLFLSLPYLQHLIIGNLLLLCTVGGHLNFLGLHLFCPGRHE